MKNGFRQISAALFLLISIIGSASAQSGKTRRVTSEGASVLSITARRDNDSEAKIEAANVVLFENGVQQEIKNLALDPAASRIVLVVDNTQTVRADIDKLKQAAREFAYEIYEGDQLYIIGYDQKAEIIQEWTDDAKKVEASLETFRKQGNPNLFDALSATLNDVLLPLMPGTRKTAVVIIGDGLDRNSTTNFEKLLADYQNAGVTVYAVSAPDRTGGAYRRDKPKPSKVLDLLTTGTGGKIFDIEEPQAAAKAICDELRQNRYLLTYLPTNFSVYDERRILVLADEGISVRAKTVQPPSAQPK